MRNARCPLIASAPSELSTCLVGVTLAIGVACTSLMNAAPGTAAQTTRWEGGKGRVRYPSRLTVIVSKTELFVTFGRVVADGVPEHLHVQASAEKLRLGPIDYAGNHDFEGLQRKLVEL